MNLTFVLGLRHSYGAPSRLVSTAYCTWRWCLGTAQLRCAFALGVYSLLHLALVLELRHSYGAPSREVTAAYCTWRWCLGYGTTTLRLRAWCPLPLRLLSTVMLLELRHSYGAPSRLVTTAYCTWRWCLSYGPAMVRFRAWCQLLSAPGVGAWATAQLLCAFALGVNC